jgi:hypothetical protein
VVETPAFKAVPLPPINSEEVME